MLGKLPTKIQNYEKAIIDSLSLPIYSETRALALPMDISGHEVVMDMNSHNSSFMDMSLIEIPAVSLNDQCVKLNKISEIFFKDEDKKLEVNKSDCSSPRTSSQTPRNLSQEYLQLKKKMKQAPLEEIERLKGYKYERKYIFNEKTMRTNTVLICRYGNCNKVCNKTWDLLDHIRKHTGEKPYQCKICLKRFSQRGNVIKHNKMHERGGRKQRKKRASKAN